MLIREANAHLAKRMITEEELNAIHPIYCLLGFEKEQFCSLVDALGVDAWTANAERWERLDKAERELKAREEHALLTERLRGLGEEMAKLQEEMDALVKRRSELRIGL